MMRLKMKCYAWFYWLQRVEGMRYTHSNICDLNLKVIGYFQTRLNQNERFQVVSSSVHNNIYVNDVMLLLLNS